ncbi:receptor-like protein 13 [Quercus suber]|uniref:Receptor-like protein 13 n=1 Tax=Quercus suber TaxID=58331 RepID=A0AAW0IRY2_QUESU
MASKFGFSFLPNLDAGSKRELLSYNRKLPPSTTLINIIFHLGTQATKRVIAVSGEESSATSQLAITISYWSRESWYFISSMFLHYEKLRMCYGFERFSALSELEVHYLDGNYFNNYTLQSLSGIASLKELDLNNNNLNGAIHVKEFKAFTNLEDLYLSGTEINDLVTTVDSNILTKLQLLDLSWNDFSARVLPSSITFCFSNFL